MGTLALEAAVSLKTERVTSTLPCCKDLGRKEVNGSFFSLCFNHHLVVPGLQITKQFSSPFVHTPVGSVLSAGLHLGKRKPRLRGVKRCLGAEQALGPESVSYAAWGSDNSYKLLAGGRTMSI